MVSNIANTSEVNAFPLQDTKAQAQEQVKKEQESFQKLIEQKAKEQEKKNAASTKEDVKKTSSSSGEKSTSEKAESASENKAKESFPQEQAFQKPASSSPSAVSSPANGQGAAESKSAKTEGNPASATSLSQTGAKPAGLEKSQDTKTLGDVKNMADSSQLDAQKMKVESNTKSQENVKNSAEMANQAGSTQKKEGAPMGTQALLTQTALNANKSSTLSPADSDPLAQALKEVTAKDLATRKMNKSGGIEYKKDRGGEKVAVIARGRSLPKNITEANLANAKRGEAYKEVFEKFGVKDVDANSTHSTEAKKKV